MAGGVAELILGRRIANDEAEQGKLGAVAGVPAMGLDGLGSASYGPEAALAVLAPAGTAALSAAQPIVAAVLFLLLVLYLSYRQTIAAYPRNGGSYLVARANLGPEAGLLSAAALMIDFMLNVAVGISAGIGALISAVPGLHPYVLPLCLGVLGALTLINLRGTRESGLVLSVPTYLFIACLGGMVLTGLLAGAPHARPVAAPQAGGAVGLWLLLRAFASGCTAMTGVEAVSNGVDAFRDPPTRHAQRTLTAICAVLGGLLLGVFVLARRTGTLAMEQSQPGYESVVSQLTHAVFGSGWLYAVTMGSVLAVLALSANTSFVGFPRLCRQVAMDGYLPRPFAVPGRRLVYTAGVLFLTAGAALLLVLFDGVTDRLIPLFAVGAFLSFTLSQAGMAAHWWRERGPRWRARLAINGVGAAITAAALAIILVAKFVEGAWITLLAIPLTLLLLHRVRAYYDGVDRTVLRGSARRIDATDRAAPFTVVPVARWDRAARKAVEYALRLSPDVVALHVTSLDGPDAEQHHAELRRDWRRFVEDPARAAGLAPPELRLVPSRYRSVVAPLLRTIIEFDRADPGRPVLVVLPELIEQRWWAWIMHVHRARSLRRQLLRDGGPDVAVVSVPWQLQDSSPEHGVAVAEAGG